MKNNNRCYDFTLMTVIQNFRIGINEKKKKKGKF